TPLSSASSPLLSLTHRRAPDTSPLSLHDALPIYPASAALTDSSTSSLLSRAAGARQNAETVWRADGSSCLTARSISSPAIFLARSEEHTSELQSLTNLVCRLLLEKQKRPHPPHLS